MDALKADTLRKQTHTNLSIMNISSILESGANVQLVINALDLKEAFLQWNAEQNKESYSIPQEEYKTPNETAKMLDVDKSTLWRWAKQGYLVPVKWGNKSRYKLSDIKCCMEG